MPFGSKRDHTRNGMQIDFDSIFSRLIVPALEDADLDWSRADRSVEAGMVHVAMFRDLLGADVVLADLTTENGNVAYELGLRHALRPKSTVLIRREGGRALFDLRVLRECRYAMEDTTLSDAEAAAALPELCGTLRQAAAVDATSDSPLFDLFEIDPVPTVRLRHQVDRVVEELTRVSRSVDQFERLARVGGLTANKVTELVALSAEVGARLDPASIRSTRFRIGSLLREHWALRRRLGDPRNTR
ncbi:MAG: hypothetical protein R2715_21920 [Ilumatobacteraceae bacterium]